jgi:stress-induced-phosphoprotein 1
MSKKAAEDFKAKGNAAFSKKQYKEAIDWYTKAVQQEPNDATFYSNRCAAYMALDKFTEALRDSEHCIRIQPNWVKGWYRKGAALVSLGRYEEAVMAFKKGVELEPGNEDLKNRLAEAEQKAKYAPKRFADDGTPLSPAQLAKEEGNALFRNGKYDAAIEKYTRAIELTTNDEEKAIFLSNRATCHAQLQNHVAVVEDCTAAINIKPTAKTLIRRGLAYESLEKYKLALEDMKQVLHMDPSAVVASQSIARLTRAINTYA